MQFIRREKLLLENKPEVYFPKSVEDWKYGRLEVKFRQPPTVNRQPSTNEILLRKNPILVKKQICSDRAVFWRMDIIY